MAAPEQHPAISGIASSSFPAAVQERAEGKCRRWSLLKQKTPSRNGWGFFVGDHTKVVCLHLVHANFFFGSGTNGNGFVFAREYGAHFQATAERFDVAADVADLHVGSVF